VNCGSLREVIGRTAVTAKGIGDKRVERSDRRIAGRLVLAVFLLFAQIGAQMHAYAHVDPDSRPVDPAGLHTQRCIQCLSSAPLFSAVGTATATLDFDWGVAITAVGWSATLLHVKPGTRSFQSRAPPALL
jgi:hypothetical protein